MSDAYCMAHLTRMFGSFTELLTEAERTHYDCPSEVFNLILMLRLLVGDAGTVMYKATWDYGLNDADRNSVDIFLYRPNSVPAFTKVAGIAHDSAESIPTDENFSDYSSGSYEAVSVESPFGYVFGSIAEKLELLLRNAAAAGGKQITFIRRNDGETQILLHDETSDTVKLIGIILTKTGWGGYLGVGNCALKLI